MITILYIFAAAIRWYYAFRLYPAESYLFSDMEDYFQQALRIVDGNFHPSDSFKPQAYYLWVALSIKLSRIGVFSEPLAFLKWTQFLISLATCWIAARMSVRWLGKLGSNIVLGISLFYFPFIGFSALVMAETCFAFFLSLFFLRIFTLNFPFRSSQIFTLGLLWGIAVLFKAQLLVFLPLVIIYLWLLTVRSWRAELSESKKKKTLLLVSLLLLGAIIPILAQSLWFYQVDHLFHLLPGNGAATFVAGKCNACGEIRDSDGASICLPNRHLNGGCEPTCQFDRPFSDTQFYWKTGLNCLRENPGEVIYSLRNVFYLFMGNESWPFQAIEELRGFNQWWEYLFLILLFPGFILASLQTFKRKTPVRIQLVFLVILSLFLCCYLIQGELRFRTPFDYLFIPLSIWGWGGLRKKRGRRLSTT